jgi:hypothetical protein
MRHLMTVGATVGAPDRVRDVAVGRPQCPRDVRRGNTDGPGDIPSCGGRGPEEIALDAWLEDVGPYVSLVEVFGSVTAALGGRNRADAPRTRRVAHMTATPLLGGTFA